MVENNSTRSSLLVDQGSCDTVSNHVKPSLSIDQRTYVADVDDLVLLSARGGEVGERVGGCLRDSRAGIIATCSRTSRATRTTTVSTTASKTTTEASAAAAKASTTAEAAAKATSCSEATEATTATAAHLVIGKPVFADFEETSLPVVAVELLNGAASVVGGLEENRS